MSKKTTVQFIDHGAAFMETHMRGLMGRAKRMGTAIIANARVRTPMSENGGNLRNSGGLKEEGKSIIVSFGGGQVPYGLAQERGTNGIVVFRHYTTPGTGAHFLEESAITELSKGLGAF